MDSKIILAILIVALIGIVAATYQHETSDVINTLTSVDTEDSASDNIADQDSDGVESGNSQNNLRIDEDVVKPDTNVVATGSANNQQKANTRSSASANTNNNQASNNQQNTNQAQDGSNTNSQGNNQISQEKAIDIALKNLPSQFSNAQVDKATRYNDVYLVSFKENGEIIGEYEISASNGKVTGGAFKNEVPNPSDVVQQTQNNSGN